MSELQDEIYSDDSWLSLLEMNKINALLDESLDYIWNMIYGKNRKKNEINNIDIDKDMDIVNDKSELVNKLGELLDSIMIELQNVVGTDNYDNLLKNLKKWRSSTLKLIKGNTSEKKDKPNTSEKKMILKSILNHQKHLIA